MYKSIYVAIDNSEHALCGLDVAIGIARPHGAVLTGSHVYAARLHDRRFRQMEGGLPDRYLAEEKLTEQRDIHDDLITRGLEIISDSYLDVFEKRSAGAGAPCRRVSLEGRNWQRLVEDIRASDCDLVVMGARGLGAVETVTLGSVCERVARRIDRDLLVARKTAREPAGPIVVAIDGSPHSFGGLKTALTLGRIFARPVEAVSVFDPYFHYAAFNSIAGVLSPEAASVFRFKEQEKLHEEIIDGGLAKIYQAQLDLAAKIAAAEGETLATTLLAGKAFEQVLKHAAEREAWLLVLGRIGIHSNADMDIGSNAENLLRLAGCSVLLSARTFVPPAEEIAETSLAWTKEAQERMARVPPFVRGMANRAVVRYAVTRGYSIVTSDVIDGCLGAFMPAGAEQAMREIVDTAGHAVGKPLGKCPFAHRGAMAGAGAPSKSRSDAPSAPAAPEAMTGSRAAPPGEKTANGAGRAAIAESQATVEGVTGAFFACTACGYAVRGFAPEECPICRADGARFAPVTGRAQVTPASLRALRWTKEGEAMLATVPAGFVRELTRWRVEAWARRHGRLEVTADIVGSKLAAWETTSAPFAPTLPWDGAATAKMERMPPGVRSAVMRALEGYARKCGGAEVTGTLLRQALAAWHAGESFHGGE